MLKFTKVRNVSSKKEETYDISVRNNHNLFVNDHLIHNSDYRGEVKVILHNFGSKVYKTYKGDRIAQGMIHEVLEVEIAEVERLAETERGEGGIGSTGR